MPILSSPRWLLVCAALLSAPAAYAQGYPPAAGGPPPAANPMCQRLESQLAMIDRGGADPAKAEQIRRYEEAQNRQQAELDRVTTQAKRMGCDSTGLFSLFNGQAAQCGPVNNQIQQMRANLDQITGSLQQLRGGGGGGSERDMQRRSVLLALAQNNCGPQYAAAARAAQPGEVHDHDLAVRQDAVLARAQEREEGGVGGGGCSGRLHSPAPSLLKR